MARVLRRLSLSLVVMLLVFSALLSLTRLMLWSPNSMPTDKPERLSELLWVESIKRSALVGSGMDYLFELSWLEPWQVSNGWFTTTSRSSWVSQQLEEQHHHRNTKKWDHIYFGVGCCRVPFIRNRELSYSNFVTINPKYECYHMKMRDARLAHTQSLDSISALLYLHLQNIHLRSSVTTRHGKGGKGFQLRLDGYFSFADVWRSVALQTSSGKSDVQQNPLLCCLLSVRHGWWDATDW